MTFHSCFTDLYNGMTHIAKRTTTETTWDSILCEYVTATTDVENRNTTFVTNWRGSMVPCPCEPLELDVDGKLSYNPISVTDKVRKEFTQWYIFGMFVQTSYESRVLFTRHESNVTCIVRYRFIHYKILKGSNPHICIKDMKRELSKRISLQRRRGNVIVTYVQSA